MMALIALLSLARMVLPINTALAARRILSRRCFFERVFDNDVAKVIVLTLNGLYRVDWMILKKSNFLVDIG